MPAADAGVLDEALERFAATGVEFAGGLSNHGPMGAEALVRLGRADAVPAWADAYARRLTPPDRPTGARIDDANWPDALGDRRRTGDWIDYFARSIAARPWTEVVATWAPRLAPGWVSSALHGTIRAAHAVRALSEADSEPRRHELAVALAYWAASYEELPGGALPSFAAGASALDVSRLDEGATSLPHPGIDRRGLISTVVRPVGGDAAFERQVAATALPGELDAALTRITTVAARLYLANAAHAWIPYVHAVTGPSAVRLLLPLLAPDDQRAAVAHAWRAVAALHAAYGDAPPAPLRDEPQRAEPPPVDPTDLVARAVADGDEHVIKLVEACLREHAVAADPAYLDAAAHVVGA